MTADLTADTAVNVTKAAFQTVNMTAGAATIDLTALLLNGAAVTLTGLEPRASASPPSSPTPGTSPSRRAR